MRERVEESEVPVHVFVFDERPTHDDLRNQHQRDDVGRRFRIGDERRDKQTKRHAAHCRHEHDSQVNPKHPADLQDVITDQDKKDALNQRKYPKGKRF